MHGSLLAKCVHNVMICTAHRCCAFGFGVCFVLFATCCVYTGYVPAGLGQAITNKGFQAQVTESPSCRAVALRWRWGLLLLDKLIMSVPNKTTGPRGSPWGLAAVWSAVVTRIGDGGSMWEWLVPWDCSPV